jgi:hypothetical protein
MKPTRRQLLRNAAGASLAVAISPNLLRSASAAGTPTSEWLRVMASPTGTYGVRHSTSSRGPASLLGLDSNARTIGQIDGVLPSIFRDPTGAVFVLPWARWQGNSSTTVVQLFSASSGIEIAAITGHRELQRSSGELSDAIEATVSADGHWLLLLHKFLRETGTPSKRVGSSTYKAIQTLAVELIDLQGRVVMDYRELETVDRVTVVRDTIRCAVDASRAYVIGRRLAGAGFSSVLWSFDVGTGALVLKDHTMTPVREDPARRSLLPDPGLRAPDWLISTKTATLVAYEVPLLRVFRLPVLELLFELTIGTIPSGARFPPLSFPVFDASAAFAHVIDPSNGTADTADVTQGQAIRHQRVTAAGTVPASVPSLPREAVVASADGTHLLFVDNRIGATGLWSLMAADLGVVASFLVGHKLEALSAGADGSVFALSRGEDRVYVLDSAGNLRANAAARGASTFEWRKLP